MKNIYLIPTDKPSRVYSKDGNYKLDSITIAMDWYISEGYKPQNINITNNEDIKEGDWCIVTPFGADKFAKVVRFKKENGTLYNLECKKIILTTDADLIKDGVQAIDDEFLEWFVKNPSCEEVEVIKQELNTDYRSDWKQKFHYKIIIPKEEPCTCTDECLGYLTKTCKRIKGEPKHKGKELTTEEVMESRSSAYEFLDFDNYHYKETFESRQYYTPKEEPKQETLEEVPTELDSVLAKISHQNDLGLSQWYEVVYYTDGKWCSYSGSKTFQDGERVLEWKYCKDLI